MATQIKMEWQVNPKAWKNLSLPIFHSKNGNIYVKHQGKVYVFKDFKEGTRVYGENRNFNTGEARWVVEGRITKHGAIFLGTGLSYDEYCETPEGQAEVKKMLESLRKW